MSDNKDSVSAEKPIRERHCPACGTGMSWGDRELYCALCLRDHREAIKGGIVATGVSEPEQVEHGTELTLKYRKKPLVIESIQYTGDNLKQVIDFTGKHPKFDEWFSSFEEYIKHVHNDKYAFKIFTLEGTMEAMPGDYIIRGVKGEFYPCKPDIFEATYEKVPSPVIASSTNADSGGDNARIILLKNELIARDKTIEELRAERDQALADLSKYRAAVHGLCDSQVFKDAFPDTHLHLSKI